MVVPTGVFQWKDIAELAKDVSDDALNNRLRSQAVNKACVLIFTVSVMNIVNRNRTHLT